MDKVSCLECGKELTTLVTHLRAHKINLEQYKNKYRDPVTGQDPPVGQMISHKGGRQKANKPPIKEVKKDDKLVLDLTKAEQKAYHERYAVLFLQADEDPALAPSIKDIVRGEIFIDRYQGEIDRISAKVRDQQPLRSTDVELLTLLDRQIKETQKTNLALMDSLNLTRAKKKQTKQVVESTPSRLVSALESYLEGHTAEQHKRQEQEIVEAEERLRRNLQRLKHEISDPDDEPT